MKSYPALKEMGINNPHEITSYTLHQVGNVDYLRIYYKRKKNSFLPVNKRFKFGRSEKFVLTDGGQQKTEVTYPISPFLQKAMTELDSLIKDKSSREDTILFLHDEIQRVQDDFCAELDALKALINKLK